MPTTSEQPRIVVGVTPTQVERVLPVAATFAQKFGGVLECVLVDADQFTAVGSPGGTVADILLAPSDPQTVPAPDVNQAALAEIERILSPLGVEWNARALQGKPADALMSVADDVDAAMIVIGARRPGLVKSLAKLLNGSVAAHLMSRQHRPVVTVPLNPVAAGEAAPWTIDEQPNDEADSGANPAMR